MNHPILCDACNGTCSVCTMEWVALMFWTDSHTAMTCSMNLPLIGGMACRPRDSTSGVLHRLLAKHWEHFQRVYDQRFRKRFW